MVAIKFDPTKSAWVSDSAIHLALVNRGAVSRDEDGLLARDVGRTTRLRWDVTLELDSLEAAQGLADDCQRHELGRVRLVGATWEDPWVVSDRLMVKRRKHREDQEQRRSRLSATTAQRLSFA